MRSLFFSSFALALVAADYAFAAPLKSRAAAQQQSAGLSIPLTLRDASSQSAEQRIALFDRHLAQMHARYGGGSAENTAGAVRRDGILPPSAQSFGLMDMSNDMAYTATVSIGTPAQNLSLTLDTGSSDLWVVSSACSTGNCQNATSKFVSSSSSSFKSQDGSSFVPFGAAAGDAGGVLGSDTVAIGNYSVPGQVFGIINNSSAALNLPTNTSGVMGLGLPNTSNGTKATPWWFALATNTTNSTNPALWTVGLFALSFGRASDQKAAGGFIDIGSVNPKRYTSHVTYLNVSSSAAWAVPMDGYSIGGKMTSTNNSKALIDSGMSTLGGTPDKVKEFYAQIQGAQLGSDGSWTYPCSSLTDLSFMFGNTSYVIQASDFSMPLSTGNANCKGALSAISGNSFDTQFDFVLGTPFIKNVYTVFEAINPPRIGFAPASNGAFKAIVGSRGAMLAFTGAVITTILMF